ncbi:hypothetical protein EJ08DRAFT_203839 [Tothia fuscella]|uniref:Uncharacterized protein n=1 Tax=Tothia fuscella TaxID=1048955 RepID=A0A9P4NTC2_9PEZI|nr:hypothetical protein EJ08DRAFT_203839 [Tothia fuscella]
MICDVIFGRKGSLAYLITAKLISLFNNKHFLDCTTADSTAYSRLPTSLYRRATRYLQQYQLLPEDFEWRTSCLWTPTISLFYYYCQKSVHMLRAPNSERCVCLLSYVYKLSCFRTSPMPFNSPTAQGFIALSESPKKSITKSESRSPRSSNPHINSCTRGWLNFNFLA